MVDQLAAYWSQLQDSLLSELRSSPEGLSTADAAQRLATYGPNLLQTRERATELGLFLTPFRTWEPAGPSRQ